MLRHEKQAYLSDLDWSIHTEICLIESLVLNDGWSYLVAGGWWCLYLCLSIIDSPDTGYLTLARQHNNETISSHHSNQLLPSAIKKSIWQQCNIEYKQKLAGYQMKVFKMKVPTFKQRRAGEDMLAKFLFLFHFKGKKIFFINLLFICVTRI